MPLDDELRAMRRTKAKHNEEIEASYTEYYEGLFRRALRLAAPARVRPVRFHIVESMQRRCELRGGPDDFVLVYDRYLGRSVSALTRMMLLSSDANDIATYYCKVAAEELHVRHEYRIAAMLLAVHRVLLAQGSSYRENETAQFLQIRARYVTTAELFIMLHELVHSIAPMERRVLEMSFDLALSMAMEELLPHEREWVGARVARERLREDEAFLTEFWCDLRAMLLVAAEPAPPPATPGGIRRAVAPWDVRLTTSLAMGSCVLALECEGYLGAVASSVSDLATAARGSPSICDAPTSLPHVQVRSALLQSVAAQAIRAKGSQSDDPEGDIALLRDIRAMFARQIYVPTINFVENELEKLVNEARRAEGVFRALGLEPFQFSEDGRLGEFLSARLRDTREKFERL
jgi:hypothetical protein